MKIKLPLLRRLHLDPRHMLLNARGLKLLQLFFKELDVRNMESLDDVAFVAFMQVATDLREGNILQVSLGLRFIAPQLSEALKCCRGAVSAP